MTDSEVARLLPPYTPRYAKGTLGYKQEWWRARKDKAVIVAIGWPHQCYCGGSGLRDVRDIMGDVEEAIAAALDAPRHSLGTALPDEVRNDVRALIGWFDETFGDQLTLHKHEMKWDAICAPDIVINRLRKAVVG